MNARGLRWCLTLLAAPLLSGCLFKSDLGPCHKAREYQKAEPGPQVEIPGDLEPLDDAVRLKVPEGERMTEPTPKDQPCLIEPPPYSERRS